MNNSTITNSIQKNLTIKPLTPERLNHWFTHWINNTSIQILWVFIRVWYDYRVVHFEHYAKCKQLTPKGGYILASNHQASMDIPFVVSSVPWGHYVAFMAKQELFLKSWFTNWYFTVTGTIAVNRAQLEKSTLKAVKLVLSNPQWLMAIFPEGTRSDEGSVSEVKAGTTFISKLCGVPILPVGIAWANHGKGFRPKVRVVIAEPIQLHPEETLEAYTQRFQAVLRTARLQAVECLKN